MNMNIMRRGGASSVSAAGDMVSSQGKASAAPAPRRRVLREIGWNMVNPWDNCVRDGVLGQGCWRVEGRIHGSDAETPRNAENKKMENADLLPIVRSAVYDAIVRTGQAPDA